VNFLAKKKGEKYKCEECGLVVLVEDVCGCSDCDLICCDVPMKPVKETKAQTKSKAPEKAKAKPKPAKKVSKKAK
jgi:hypothetical protein